MIRPRTAYRAAIVVLVLTGPLAVLTLLAWGFRWDLANARPQLTLMAYMLLLLLAVAAGAVAILASTQAAIHKAFSHGYRTAMYQAGYDTMDQRHEHGRHEGSRVVQFRQRNGTDGTPT